MTDSTIRLSCSFVHTLLSTLREKILSNQIEALGYLDGAVAMLDKINEVEKEEE